jgi:hypothetical protein
MQFATLCRRFSTTRRLRFSRLLVARMRTKMQPGTMRVALAHLVHPRQLRRVAAVSRRLFLTAAAAPQAASPQRPCQVARPCRTCTPCSPHCNRLQRWPRYHPVLLHLACVRHLCSQVHPDRRAAEIWGLRACPARPLHRSLPTSPSLLCAAHLRLQSHRLFRRSRCTAQLVGSRTAERSCQRR